MTALQSFNYSQLANIAAKAAASRIPIVKPWADRVGDLAEQACDLAVRAKGGMSMTVSQEVPRKRYGLFILAILLLLSGGAALYVGSHNFAIRSLGLVAIVASAYLVRISRVHSRSGSSVASGEGVDSKATTRPGRLLWTVSIALLLLAGVSYLNLYNDALHGYYEVWPVYVFAVVGVAYVLVWSYLVSRIVR